MAIQIQIRLSTSRYQLNQSCPDFEDLAREQKYISGSNSAYFNDKVIGFEFLISS